MSVEDLLTRMVSWKTFVHDVEEFSSYLVLTLPRGVVTCEAASFLAVSCINSVVHR